MVFVDGPAGAAVHVDVGGEPDNGAWSNLNVYATVGSCCSMGSIRVSPLYAIVLIPVSVGASTCPDLPLGNGNARVCTSEEPAAGSPTVAKLLTAMVKAPVVECTPVSTRTRSLPTVA